MNRLPALLLLTLLNLSGKLRGLMIIVLVQITGSFSIGAPFWTFYFRSLFVDFFSIDSILRPLGDVFGPVLVGFFIEISVKNTFKSASWP